MMFSLPVSDINKKSPYLVWSSVKALRFSTDYDVLYEVGFVGDYMVCDNNIYQFFIVVIDGVPNRFDLKVSQTVTAILEEFFQCNDAAIVYICDTSDGRQHVRDRLFRIWFNSYSRKNEFELLHGDVEVEGFRYFASCLFSKDSMLNELFRNSFERFVIEFKEK